MSAPERDLPYGRHFVTEDDIAAVVEALKGDFLTTGARVAAFERELASYCGSKFAVVCSSGTAGLHLAAAALELRPGDTVVTSPITFVATANAARYCGADVRFADVRIEDGNIELSSLENLLQAKDKAVFPVHYAGKPCDMESLHRAASKRGVRIVEDACHALGAEYSLAPQGKSRVGSCAFSDMTVFSFHPVKHVTTGEGGAVTTNDERLYRRLLSLRSHGITRERQEFRDAAMAFDSDGEPNPWYYEMQNLGWNYRLSDIQCALGLSQLKRIDANVSRRAELAEIYCHELTPLSKRVRPLEKPEAGRHAYHLFVAQIDFRSIGTSRAHLMRELKSRGIQTQVHYIPVHLQPYYRDRAGPSQPSLPKAERFYESCISLPLFPEMTDKDVKRVVSAIAEILDP